MTGAIRRHTVPATIIKSDCRGEPRNTPAPNRSISYREETAAIISMAQQASPKVIGQREPFLAQFTAFSRDPVMTSGAPSFSCRPSWISPIPSSVPLQRTFSPGIHVGHNEQPYKNHHFNQPNHPDLGEYDSPRIEEDHFNIKDDEQHRKNVISDGKRHTGVGKWFGATFVGR